VRIATWSSVRHRPLVSGNCQSIPARRPLPESVSERYHHCLITDNRSDQVPEDRLTLPEFLRVAAPVALPTTLLWLSSYLLLVAAARRLDAADLGAAVTCVALFLIFDAGITPIRRPSPRASSSQAPKAVVRSRRSLLLDLGPLTLLFLVASPFLSLVFHLGWEPLTLLLPAVIAAGLRNRSRLHEHPGPKSLGPPLIGGVARMLAGIGLVAMGLGLTGVLLALLAGEVTMLVLELLTRARAVSPRDVSLPVRYSFAAAYPYSVVASVSLALFAHADVLLARHFLPRAAAGEYAGAAMVARSLLFVAAAVTLVLQARVARVQSGDPFRWLRHWVATGAAGVLTAGLALVLFRGPVLRGLLGPDAVSGIGAFPLIVAAVGLLAIVWQLSYFHWLVGSNAHILTIIGILVEVVVVLAVLPATDDRIALVMLVAVGLTAVLQYQAAWAITRWSPPLSLLRTHEEVGLGPAVAERPTMVELSIIVPCHNAGPGLHDFLGRLERELSAGGSYEIVVVSDGSTDETFGIARELASPTLRVVHYPERSGKGHALRVGLSRARGQYVGFIDSDGDIDPRAIGPFLALMRLYQPDIVLGSKRHPMSQVAYPPLRRVMSWVYHKLTRLLFRVNVRDTQTGLKVVRRAVLVAVLPRMFEKRYAWDLELLVVARMLGFTKVFEAPVRIEYRFSSQVNPNAAFRIILDSVAIFYRRYILNSYRHTAYRLAVIRDDQARV
jgi:hypothetical protein